MPKVKTIQHVFDRETLYNLNKLESDGYIGQLIGPVGTGKESYVFLSKDYKDRSVAVKIHRHNIQSFNKIPAYLKLRGAKTGGFFKTIDDWSRFEYNFLSRAFNSGVNVPEPYRLFGNIIVMQFIGEESTPARLAVKDTSFDLDGWYSEIIGFIITMGKKHFVHGDLSPYNILNFKGIPYIIDFSQALKLTGLTEEYLFRDIRNINTWFKKLGKQNLLLEADVASRIQESH